MAAPTHRSAAVDESTALPVSLRVVLILCSFVAAVAGSWSGAWATDTGRHAALAAKVTELETRLTKNEESDRSDAILAARIEERLAAIQTTMRRIEEQLQERAK